MARETSLCVVMPPGRKRGQLFYKKKAGVYVSIAILRVSEREFWDILERELGIKFMGAEIKKAGGNS